MVIWRYPIMLRQQMAEFHGEMPSAQSKISLALPRSHCPHCQQTIRVRDNIPLLSRLMLKGRCRDCQAKISKRYPLVELLTALAFAGESGLAGKWMGAGGDDIIRTADCREHHRPRSPMAARCFTQGVLWTGLIAAWAQQSPLTLQDAVTGVWWGLSLLLSALDSRNSSA